MRIGVRRVYHFSRTGWAHDRSGVLGFCRSRRTGSDSDRNGRPSKTFRRTVFDGGQFHTIVPRIFGDKPSWGRNQILLQSRAGDWWAATKVGLCRFAATCRATDLAETTADSVLCAGRRRVPRLRGLQGRHLGLGQSAQGERLLRWDPATEGDLLGFEMVPRGRIGERLCRGPRTEHLDGALGGGLLCYDGRQFMRLQAARWSAAQVPSLRC